MTNIYPYYETVRDLNLLLTKSRRRYGNTRLPVIRIGDDIIAVSFTWETTTWGLNVSGINLSSHQSEYDYGPITSKQLMDLFTQTKHLYTMTDAEFNRIYPQERN